MGDLLLLNIWSAAAAAKSLQSCLTLCDPIDGSPPGSPVPGILQARTLEWVAISFSNAWKWKVNEVAQSCPTLSDPVDCSPPGSSVHRILQARTLEWVASSLSNAWKWKVKVKSLSRSDFSRPRGLQPTRLLRPWDFPGKSTGLGCHCLLQNNITVSINCPNNALQSPPRP